MIRFTKGKNVIVTSAADDAMLLRGPYDVSCPSMAMGLRTVAVSTVACGVSNDE